MIALLCIAYYIAGVFSFCWAFKAAGDYVDAYVISLALIFGWIVLPFNLLIIALLKVFR